MGEEAFQAYYKFTDETMDFLKKPQIKTFRINRSHKFHNLVEELALKLGCKRHESFNDLFTLPKEIGYYKAWDNENSIRVEKSIHKKTFSLMAETGLIYYQEVSSFLPVYLLDVKREHKVLDMCSSPGSKTTQLISMTDFLVANEPNNKRRNVLITNTSKFDTSNLIVTNYDGRFFPTKFKFDRILCDVPCSSDGTIRKDPSILKFWNINKSKGLAKLQAQILKRSLELLEEDGIAIYSTCTFNKMENEDVLEEVLDHNYEILDVTNKLNNFKVRRGLTEKTYNAMRIFPEDNDTGGFFICVIRKIPKEDKKIKPIKNESKDFNLTNSKIEFVDDSFISSIKVNYPMNSNQSFFKNSINSLKKINTCLVPLFNYTHDVAGVKAFDLIKINNTKIWRPLQINYELCIDKQLLYSLLKDEFIDYPSERTGFIGVFMII